MTDDKNNLLLLFQRPLEPLFTKKDDGKTVFDLPEDYYTDRYKPIGTELASRFGEDVDKRVPLRAIKYPDLSFADSLDRKDGFSLFNPKHKQMAAKLTKIFLDVPESKLLSIAAYVKDRVNVYLYQYALSVALAHRPDTKDLQLPSIVQLFPDQFIDPSAFPKAREELSLVSPGNRISIEIPINFTASDREDEQRMAYFREDIGVNMHHWHWHLVYPAEGDDRVVRKDRRGELFYYMHHQIIIRYNVDRICNGLERVRPLSSLRGTVPGTYFPKIIRSSNNRSYPPRISDVPSSEINRDDTARVEMADIDRWRDRIYQAIDQGYVVDPNGRRVSILGLDGIDILGDNLQHAPFEYTINAQNGSNAIRVGLCRLFMCPKNDERGTPLNFEDQRNLMIEMDMFRVNLNPGMNVIRRRSDESSVTIPYERSFRQIGRQFRPAPNTADGAQFEFCGCGWPQHMLLPRGSIQGTKFYILAMITDYELDRVVQPDVNNRCNTAISFCGLRGQQYPVRRSMGFPFDRPFRADQLIDFKNLGTNMAIGECDIKFTNTIVNRT